MLCERMVQGNAFLQEIAVAKGRQNRAIIHSPSEIRLEPIRTEREEITVDLKVS